jgi:hypothetical protein
MTQCLRTRTWIVAGGALLLFAAGPVASQQQSCVRCKYRRCIESTIEQKRKLEAGYLQLAREWQGAWVESGTRAPLNEVDLATLQPQSRRLATLTELARQHERFAVEVEDLASRIGPPADCNYDPAQSVEMSTDVVNCAITGLREAEGKVPCRELFEIARRHEAAHLARCQARKGGKTIPSRILTPAGQAREEAEAYREEIGELGALLKQIGEAKLDHQTNVSVRLGPLGTLVIQSTAEYAFTQNGDVITGSGAEIQTGKLVGGECHLTGFPRTLHYALSGRQVGEELEITLVPSGPGDRKVPETRMVCPKSTGVAPASAYSGGTFRIRKTDGAKIVINNGAARATITLHFCPRER